MRADDYTINLRAWGNAEKLRKEQTEAQVERYRLACEEMRRHALFLMRSDDTYYTGLYFLRQIGLAEEDDEQERETA